MKNQLNYKTPLLCDYVRELCWHERALNNTTPSMKRCYREDLLAYQTRGGIYGYYNLKTKQYYIGQTSDFVRRFIEHLTSKNGQPFDAVLQKYWRDFTFAILEICDKDIRDYREQLYIEYYLAQEDGYNIQKGNYKKIEYEKQFLLPLEEYIHPYYYEKSDKFLTRKESQKKAREKILFS